MKRGELAILWMGGLLSAALLWITIAPLSRGLVPADEPIIGGYVFNLVTRLFAIWLICGLVWITLYKRSPATENQLVQPKPTKIDKVSSRHDGIVKSTVKYLWAFLTATVRDWIGIMSGSFGLLFTIAGFFSLPGSQPRIFLYLGLVCLFFASYRAWLSEYKSREELLQQLRPRLEFERVNNVKPFYELFEKGSDTTLRCLRVGVRNLGAVEISQVRLVLEACDPGDSAAVHPEHELQPMGKPQGTMIMTIPPHGTVIFDVAQESVVSPEHYGRLSLCYAQPLQNELPRRDTDSYKIILRAEGAGPARRCSLELGGRVAWRLDGLMVLPATPRS